MGAFVLVASFHASEKLTWVCEGFGLMGYVSTCMLIVVFRTCCSSCGVCKFVVRFTWLCMHILLMSRMVLCVCSILSIMVWGHNV